MKELQNYLDRLNAANDFNLAWEWDGAEDEPYIRVFEEADNHELCSGTEEEIIELVRDSLGFWGLEDA